MPDNPSDFQDPTKVDIVKASGAPLPVEIVAGIDPIKPTGPPVQSQTLDPSRPATTTFEQNLMTAGQRWTSKKWETTQQIIAISFAAGAIGASLYLIIVGPLEMRLVAFTFLTTMAATINQNYFTRTNHTKIGGVSEKDTGR